MTDTNLIEKVRRALGRTSPLQTPPVPPAIDEPITRLVHTDIGLPELWAKHAEDQKMHVATTSPDDLPAAVVQFLRENNCRRIALSKSPILERLQILPALRAAGFEAKLWPDMTLHELYEYDCGITDVTYAVAETGSLVIKPSADHGRGLSLVPMFHVAIVEPKNLLPDLVDLMEKLAADPDRSNWILITGPSKTADIEMNTVTGVHGPNIVQAFLLK